MIWIVAGLCLLIAPTNAVVLRGGSSALPMNRSEPEMHIPVAVDSQNASDVFTNRPSVTAPPPSMFVAVFTTRSTSVVKRDSIRKLWQEVDAWTGNICTRFVVCNRNDNFEQSLLAEQSTHKDLLFLDCEEGYADGLLTKKVIATMKKYHESSLLSDPCLNRPYFMKVDDDTFVAGHHFRNAVANAANMYGEALYIGVDLPAQPANRNPKSNWYEPLSAWPNNTDYPPAMYGGPGYILGRSMVQRIVAEGIADSNMLWNEDRAVGVWVNTLQTLGVAVNWVHIPGSNGFFWDAPIKTGVWAQYPYVLHHHLSHACILCLVGLDWTNNPAALINPCFQLEPLPE